MPNMTEQEIEDRYRYHSPSGAGRARHERLSREFAQLHKAVQELVPDGRERAIVLTKLQEAKFWGSAGIALNPETR